MEEKDEGKEGEGTEEWMNEKSQKRMKRRKKKDQLGMQPQKQEGKKKGMEM